MAEHYDVIVAGGGPAGLSAARAAAAEGGKVLLLELQAQIGGQTQSASWVPGGLVKGELKRAVGKPNVLTAPEDLLCYSYEQRVINLGQEPTGAFDDSARYVPL